MSRLCNEPETGKSLCTLSEHQSHVSVAGVMVGDYMECQKTTSFFWTHKMKQKGWIAFLSFFSSSRLDRLVAVATTQRRSLAHLHLRQGSPPNPDLQAKLTVGKYRINKAGEANHHRDIKTRHNNSQLARLKKILIKLYTNHWRKRSF